MRGKQVLSDLAILGGGPAFSNQLYVGRPNIGDRASFLKRVEDMLDRKWLSNNGPLVKEFEKRTADLLGVGHVIAMCNATVGLEIAARALGLTGEVIVPSFTFIATAHALQWQNLTPVFCDIEPHGHNLDPCKVEALITPQTSGIFGVHVWGKACNIGALEEIARRRNLKLMFDAAHAFGCSHKGHMIGNFGDAEVFSFHATKFLNTFEGGAITTNDNELAARIRLMTNFGFAGYDHVVEVGTNGKMSEVAAAMGLTGLDSLDTFIDTNFQHYLLYKRELESIHGIRLFQYEEMEKCNYQYVVLEVEEALTQITRDQILDILWRENVIARRYFYPGCHRMEPYASSSPAYLLPHTEAVCDRILILPTGTGVTSADVRTICSLIRFAVRNGKELRKKLPRRKFLPGE